MKRSLSSIVVVLALVTGSTWLSCRLVDAREQVPSSVRFAPPPGKSPAPEGKDVISLTEGNKVGYRVLRVSAVDDKGARTTTDVAVWYPTTDPERPFTYVYGRNSVGTHVAENGAVAPGRFPVVVYSHGATGCGLSSAFVTETLARHGFIVAGVDHTDDFYLARIRPEPGGARRKPGEAIKALAYAAKVRNTWLGDDAVSFRPQISYRPAQIRATIDLLLNSDSPFAGHVDGDKVGVMGHSFGAWTTMAVAGGVPKDADPRIRAGLTLSAPVNGTVFSGDEVAHIHTPFMMMYGSTEVTQGRGDDRKWFYDRMKAPKYMVEIANAEHTTFSGGVREEYPTLQGYLDDAPRAAMTRYAIAFMEYALKGDTQAHKQLSIRGQGISNYLYQE